MTRTMTMTSGKGGVGKTSLSAHVALMLAGQGKKVLLLDGDFSMANLDIMLGVRTEKNLSHVLFREQSLSSILVPIVPGLSLIPAGNGLREMNQLTDYQRRKLLDNIAELPEEYDFLIVDTAPGIDNNVLALNAAASEINVILTPDPSSLTDAYALIKVLNKDYRIHHFHIIGNQFRDHAEGLHQFKKLCDIAERFLNVGLDYRTTIPYDTHFRQAIRNQQLLNKATDRTPAAVAVKELAKSFEKSPRQEQLNGGLQVFWTHLVGLASEQQDYFIPRAV